MASATIEKSGLRCRFMVYVFLSPSNFRLEWKLAVDRSHLMADDKTFFVPVILGDTPEPSARVPDAFRTRQWSRLIDDKSIAALAERIAKLVDPRASASTNAD